MTVRSFGEIVAGIKPEKVFRSGQPVWRNSYYEGQLEPRLWRPVGIGREAGTRRGGARLRGAVLKAAKALDRRTRMERKRSDPGVRNGTLGEVGLAVLEALYDLVDYATGRLEPAIATLAEMTGYCYSACHAALARLRAAGFLQWIRRSRPLNNKGEAGPQVEQITNAYVLLVPTEMEDMIRRLVSNGPPADCEVSRREAMARELDAMTAALSARDFHRDFWNGDKLLGETFGRIAAALDARDAKERESSRRGETGGSG